MAGITSQLAPHSLEDVPERAEQHAVNLSTTPHSSVVYSITYAQPTKVGFSVPRTAEDPEYVKRLQGLLDAEPWVISQQVNSIAGSIVITYQLGTMSDSARRFQLANLIQAAGQEVSAIEQPAISSSQDGESSKDKETRENGEPKPRAEALLVNPPSPTPSIPESSSPQIKKVVYNVVHAIPGRIRFRVPRIAHDPKYVQRLETLFKEDPAVTSERVNRAAVSLVVTYQPGKIQDSQKHCLKSEEQAISYLSRLIQSAASDKLYKMRS